MKISNYNTYDFETKYPKVLGKAWKGMQVIAISTFQEAITKSNIADTIANIQASYPEFREVWKDSVYVTFKQIGTEETITISEEWIDKATMVLVTSRDMNFRINNISNDDIEIIKEALLGLGYASIISKV